MDFREIFNHEKIKVFLYLIGTLGMLFIAQKAHMLSGYTFIEEWFEGHPPSPPVIHGIFKSYGYKDVSDSDRFLNAIKNIPFYTHQAHGVWMSDQGEVIVVLWQEKPEALSHSHFPGIGIFSLTEKPKFELFKSKEPLWDYYQLSWQALDPLIKKMDALLLERKKKSDLGAMQKKSKKKWYDKREVFY